MDSSARLRTPDFRVMARATRSSAAKRATLRAVHPRPGEARSPNVRRGWRPPSVSALRRVAPLLSCIASFVAVLLAARGAFADAVPLDGAWVAGPMSESITVTSWVDECGPRPKPRLLGGGSCSITSAGDELVFSGPQAYRTDACFTQE